LTPLVGCVVVVFGVAVFGGVVFGGGVGVAVFGGVVLGGEKGLGDIFGGAALSVFVFPFVSCFSVVLFAGDLDRTADRLDLRNDGAGAAAADDDDDEAAAADDDAAAAANGIGPGSLPKFFTTKSLTLARFFVSLSSASLALFRNSSAVVSISSAIFLS
jgi:hypothetical protein